MKSKLPSDPENINLYRFKSYQPKYSLKKGKKAVGPPQEGGVASTFGAEGDNYPRVQVEEIYEPTKHLNAIIGKVKGH